MSEQNIFYNAIKNVPDSTWIKLSQKKIYFGHQSIGDNILAGVRDVMTENSHIKLNIVETADKKDFNQGTFAHSKIGVNEDPKSKVDGFAKYMEEGLGDKVDIAFFKFCYIDVNSETDIGPVLNYYKDTMMRLEKRFPKVEFIHVTIPLKVVQKGPKAWIKKFIGRPIGGYADNIKRNEYNEMLLKKYVGKEPIFDIAKIESTFPDGTRNIFKKNGNSYCALIPDYSYDGRHLNELGRRKAAEQLLLLLANINIS